MNTLFDTMTNVFATANDSTFFFIVKIIIAIYVSILIADIVLIIILEGFGADLRKAFKGVDLPVSKRKYAYRWQQIEKRLESENPSHYKVAVLEADRFADEVLQHVGYEGSNMGERLASLTPAQFVRIEDLKEAHAIRNKIVHEEDFTLERDEARRILAIYEDFFKDVELV